MKVLLCVVVLCFFSLQSCRTSVGPDLPQAAAFNTQLGLGYLRQNHRPRAKKKLLQALAQAPRSPEVNAAVAYYFEQTQDWEQATKYYTKALALSAHSGEQLNNYGAFLCRRGEHEKAIEYFLKAAREVQYVQTAGAYENAGLCAMAIPDYQKAKRYFTQALQQDPTRKESLYELQRLGSVDNSLSTLNKRDSQLS